MPIPILINSINNPTRSLIVFDGRKKIVRKKNINKDAIENNSNFLNSFLRGLVFLFIGIINNPIVPPSKQPINSKKNISVATMNGISVEIGISLW